MHDRVIWSIIAGVCREMFVCQEFGGSDEQDTAKRRLNPESSHCSLQLVVTGSSFADQARFMVGIDKRVFL